MIAVFSCLLSFLGLLPEVDSEEQTKVFFRISWLNLIIRLGNDTGLGCVGFTFSSVVGGTFFSYAFGPIV